MPTSSVDKKINKLSEKIVKYTNNVDVLREELKQARLALREAKKKTLQKVAKRGGGNENATIFKNATTRFRDAINTVMNATAITKQADKKKEQTSKSKSKLNEIVVIVLGMGCDDFVKTEYNSKGTDLNYIAAYYSGMIGRRSIILCEQGINAVIGNIAKLALGVGGPTAGVVDRTYKKIIDLVNDKTIDRVDIVGHSYGGSVISAVLEKWNTQINKTTDTSLHKCHVHTLGSIYIPPPSKTNKLVSQGMTINHYMFTNDVAQKVKRPPKSANIILIGDFKKSMTVFGTKFEWEIHSRFVDDFIRYAITQKLKPEEVKEKMDAILDNMYAKKKKSKMNIFKTV